ncbi:hypothetical protein BAOM_0752 [Peribacillus asahii]|uniref:Uncharacterized protein n=1 Tax=Peribacillus asahii TaxID=228899 RepID=A0A3T0KMA2_9BACI|nr:hypothetical protein BAOM_0752 [Peribacillus asahii]
MRGKPVGLSTGFFFGYTYCKDLNNKEKLCGQRKEIFAICKAV